MQFYSSALYYCRSIIAVHCNTSTGHSRIAVLLKWYYWCAWFCLRWRKPSNQEISNWPSWRVGRHKIENCLAKRSNWDSWQWLYAAMPCWISIWAGCSPTMSFHHCAFHWRKTTECRISSVIRRTSSCQRKTLAFTFAYSTRKSECRYRIQCKKFLKQNTYIYPSQLHLSLSSPQWSLTLCHLNGGFCSRLSRSRTARSVLRQYLLTSLATLTWLGRHCL